MTDIPTPPNPVKAAKGLPGRLKGLPPWAYVAAIGVGAGAVWYGVSRSRANSAATAADTTGVSDPNADLSASSDGQVYPDGGLPSGSGFDYSSLGQLANANTDANSTAIRDLSDLLGNLRDVGVIGGGTSGPGPVAAPAPTVIIQTGAPVAPKTAPKKGLPSSGPSKTSAKTCPKSFPRHNASAGPPGPGTCYKCEKSNSKRYPWTHVYANGHKVSVTHC